MGSSFGQQINPYSGAFFKARNKGSAIDYQKIMDEFNYVQAKISNQLEN